MAGEWKRIEAGHYEHASGASVWRTVRHVNSDRACKGYTLASSRREEYWSLKFSNGQKDAGYGSMRDAIAHVEKHDPAFQ